jgi:uncharacterized membrane protein
LRARSEQAGSFPHTGPSLRETVASSHSATNPASARQQYLHRFSMEILMYFTPVVLVHLLTALGAVVVGGMMFALKKGTTLHRMLGRTWMLLMLTAVLVSFGIKTDGHYSWIHLLSVWFLIVMGMALFSIYRGKVIYHRIWVTGGYIGLVVAGIFTLMPQRSLGQLVWSTVGLL